LGSPRRRPLVPGGVSTFRLFPVHDNMLSYFAVIRNAGRRAVNGMRGFSGDDENI
jgi:hypothetical protein